MATEITRFRLLSLAPAALADFYGEALGFALGANGRLELGQSRIELALAAQGCPQDIASNDPRFQHLAIVVSDMARAYSALGKVTGWSPISLAGPETLSAASGSGVQAFKFRDPDGHPLELLCFASGSRPLRWTGRDGLHLGIDHSALAVGNVPRSLAFYAALGFYMTSRTVNTGVEQARLDGLASGAATRVEIIGLSTRSGGASLELLSYECPAMQTAIPLDAASTAATAIVMGDDGTTATDLEDPDGHRLTILG